MSKETFCCMMHASQTVCLGLYSQDGICTMIHYARGWPIDSTPVVFGSDEDVDYNFDDSDDDSNEDSGDNGGGGSSGGGGGSGSQEY